MSSPTSVPGAVSSLLCVEMSNSAARLGNVTARPLRNQLFWDGLGAGGLGGGGAAAQLCGCTAARLRGCAAAQLRGYAVTQLRGHAAMRLRGYAATRLRSYAATRLRGYAAATWLRGCAVARLRGCAATRLRGCTGLWGCVTVEFKTLFSCSAGWFQLLRRRFELLRRCIPPD